MPLILNTTSSIVDYLRSVGQDSSYSSRERLYRNLGLSDRLGSYVGSSSQNTALLNQVRNQGSQGQTSFTQPQSRTTQTPYGPAQQSPFNQPPPSRTTQTPYGQAQQSPASQTPSGSSSHQQREQFAEFLRGLGIDPGQAFSQGADPENFFVRRPQPNPTAPPASVVPQEFAGRGFEFSTEAGEPLRIGEGGTPELARAYQDIQIQSGDTLSKIAQRAGITLQELLRYNPGFTKFGRNPDLIFPGEIVKIPTERTDLPQGPSSLVTQGGTTSMQSPLASAQYAPSVPGEEGSGGTNAQDVLSSLGYSVPSVNDVMKDILKSPEFELLNERKQLTEQTAQGKADAAKQVLDFKYGQDKDTLENNLASNGLAFSGIRTEQVKALSDSLAMSKLGVDRDLAVALMDSNLDLKEDILKLATGVVQQAQQNRKEALQQLNAAGLALVGGVLVPTLSAQQYQLQQQRYALDFQLRLDQFEALQGQRGEQNAMAMQRLQIASQNAMTARERNAILNQMREIQLLSLTAVSPGQIVNAATGLPVKLTAEEKDRFAGYDSFLNAYIPQVETLLPKVQTGGAMGNYIKFAANKPLLQQTLTADQNALMSAFAAMNNALVYLQSGKQINEQEFLRLSQAMPDLTLTNTQNNIRMGQFKTLMNEIYQARLRASGFGIAGEGTNRGLVGEISTFDDEYDDFDPFGLF